MNLKDKKLNRREAGFTLVELMVGLTIGMLATVVIMQVLSVFEAQKRSTTGTADAQTNGGIALYTITRDLQMCKAARDLAQICTDFGTKNVLIFR